MGDSTPEVCDQLRIEDIAAANDAAVRELSNLLRQGEAVPGYPPVDLGRRIGMGQSMGGGVAIIMAGRHRTFDALAVLGYSAIHTVLPQRRQEDRQYVCERMAHMHNFATTRALLWDRLADWCGGASASVSMDES